MNKYCKDCFELAEKLKEKEQECEELKEKNRNLILLNQDLHNKFKTSEQICRYKDKVIDRKQTETNRYKQALEKIEEVATSTLNIVDYKTYFKRDNKSLKQEGFKGLNKIKTIINEVKNV